MKDHNGEDYIWINQEDSLALVQSARGLRGETWVVLTYIQGNLRKGNLIPSAAEIAALSGIKAPNVARAYRQLREAGFILSKVAEHYLNPRYAWNGSRKDYEEACRTLLPEAERALAEAQG